jgi:hypothetical protein
MTIGNTIRLKTMFIGSAALSAAARCLPWEVRGVDHDTSEDTHNSASIESVEGRSVFDLGSRQQLAGSFDEIIIAGDRAQKLANIRKSHTDQDPNQWRAPLRSPTAINPDAARLNPLKPLVRVGNHIHR